MAEGSLLLMLSVIAKNLILRWRLSVLFAGAMVSIIFFGLLAGTIMGGFLCDRYGRRMPILVTYIGITVFLIASLMSPDVLLLITAKFMLGVSLGFGVPAANAIVCESCPASHRSNVYSMTMVLFSLGQMYSAVVIWVMSPDINHDELHWRVMLALATLLPLVLSILSYFFLLESPHWLLAQHRYSDAKNIVILMAAYKGTKQEDLDNWTCDISTPGPGSPESHPRDPSFAEAQALDNRSCFSAEARQEMWTMAADCMRGCKEDTQRLSQLFSDKFFTSTIMMSYISFVSNFCYYGMIYGLPETLKKEQQPDNRNQWSPAAGVFFSAIFEIPGVFIAILLGTTVGRKMNMTISFACTALSLAAVIAVFNKGESGDFGLVAVFCVKMFIASVFIVVYLYLLEMYPTKFRATGLAFCMVIGRLGAFACPFLYDGFDLFGWHHKWFFIVMAVLVVVAGIMSMMLPYETKDLQLMDDDVPTDEPILTARMNERTGKLSPRRHAEAGGSSARYNTMDDTGTRRTDGV
jgi:MFS family permease